jgi:hypothetical protein
MSFLSNYVRSKGDPKIVHSGPSSLQATDRLARWLGWFSVGLGVAELVAPGKITRALGLQGKEGLVRAFGVREIGAGMLTLSTEKRAGLWSRVAGDGLDLVALAPGLDPRNPKKKNVALVIGLITLVTVLDIVSADAVSVRRRRNRGRRRDYRDRSGFPKGLQAARVAAIPFVASPSMQLRPPLPQETAVPPVS